MCSVNLGTTLYRSINTPEIRNATPLRSVKKSTQRLNDSESHVGPTGPVRRDRHGKTRRESVSTHPPSRPVQLRSDSDQTSESSEGFGIHHVRRILIALTVTPTTTFPTVTLSADFTAPEFKFRCHRVTVSPPTRVTLLLTRPNIICPS